MHPTELARQITIQDFAALKKIKPHEYLHQGWTKGKSQAVINVINRFNKVRENFAEENIARNLGDKTCEKTMARVCSDVFFVKLGHWVTTVIILGQTVDVRVSAIKQFILIAVVRISSFFLSFIFLFCSFLFSD